MTRSRLSRPVALALLALLALVLALSSTAYSAARISKANGNQLIKKHSLSGNRLKPDTVTGKEIAEQSLARVPSAAEAGHAVTADRVPAPALLSYSYGPSWGPDPGVPRAEGYRKDASGFVHLQGAVARPSGVSTLILQLPDGFRPAGGLAFPVVTATAVGTLYITAAGEVALTSGNAASVSLEGVVFYPDH